MSAVVWDQKFSVGIEDIDNQHKRLIEYVNELMKRRKLMIYRIFIMS